ncbi:MAG: hypothetical protein IJW34_08600 [Clostridia bacterium]|nr:hypothetical protein [Clostridia bacterium]
MKRALILCLLIAMVMTTLGITPVAAVEEDGLRIVSKGCSYTSTAPYVLDADKYTGNYRNKKLNELTDGVYGTTIDGSEWYAFLQGSTPHEIIVDLGKAYSDLARVRVQFGKKDDWAIILPAEVKVFGSLDGKNFTPLGVLEDVTGGTGVNHDYVADISGEYRYIRIEIAPGGFFAFVSEVDVFCGYVNTLSFPKGNAYVEGEYIYGIREKMTSQELLANANTTEGLKITDKNGKEKTSGGLATGDVITKYDKSGKTALHKYTVILDGDLSMDGRVNPMDYMLCKRYVLKAMTLSQTAAKAADANRDGKVTAIDYALIKSHVLKKHDLYEKYVPVVEHDGRGDVTEEFKDMDTSDKVELLTSYDMTLKRNSQTEYGVTCKYQGGTLYMTLHKTAWGTFNLGKWEYTDPDGTRHPFVSDSTDWEYVYRVGEKKGSWQWSGGNHDNEQMTSLKFFDGDTDKEITLNVGQTATVKNLKIVETTQLYWGDAANGYSENEHYANAVRNYTIVGPQIRLAVDYEYVKDAYYGLSYTCMFPISKKYGLYCAFLDGEDLLFVAETLKTGAADYSGKQYSGNAADRCVIWGYGGREKYKFDIRVLTPETSCNNYDNNFKVSFWDINTTSNKLYFSKWDGRAQDKMTAGDTVHTECMWTFYIDE